MSRLAVCVSVRSHHFIYSHLHPFVVRSVFFAYMFAFPYHSHGSSFVVSVEIPVSIDCTVTVRPRDDRGRRSGPLHAVPVLLPIPYQFNLSLITHHGNTTIFNILAIYNEHRYYL